MVIAAAAGCREIIDEDPVGPGNPPGGISWERTPGLDGESILSLRLDREGNIYAGTESGKLFHTATDGASWVRVPLPVDDGGISAIVVDPASTLFIANDMHGIFESLDKGDTWFRLNEGLGDTAVYSLSYVPGGRLVAGTARGEISITGDSTPIWRRKADLARPVT